MATKWPGLNSETAAVFDRVLTGRVTPLDLQQYNVRPATYFHSTDVAVGGFTSRTFFSASESEYITNWPGASGLPEEHALWVTHFGFNVIHGHSTDYTAEAGADLGLASVLPILQAEDVRGMMQLGRVVGTIGSRTFIDGQGMENYPLGIGAAMTSCTSEIAAVYHQSIAYTNGIPALANKYGLRYPIAALPGKTLRVRVTNDVAIAVAAPVILVCQIEGILVSPANL